MIVRMRETIRITLQQPTNSKVHALEVGTLGKHPSTTTYATFEPLHDTSNPIHNDAIINNSENKHVIMEDDLGRRPMEIEFTVRQTFSKREYFHDTLKEFAMVKNFELEHTKTNSRRIDVKGQSESSSDVWLVS